MVNVATINTDVKSNQYAVFAILQNAEQKKFGVGFEEEQMPELDTLTKIKSNPPQWFLNVSGSRIEVEDRTITQS